MQADRKFFRETEVSLANSEVNWEKSVTFGAVNY